MAAPAVSTGPVATTSDAGARSYTLPLVVLTSLFFMWGFLTCLNDLIIPHFKAVFELDYARAMLVQFAFFTAYFVVSLPSGKFVGRFGYKRGIVTGLLVAATGCLLFYPAAAARSYNMFLGALFILASGITLLQVAANPYVAVLGPPETASSRLTMTQAFNSAATAIAPIFGAAFILSHQAKSAAEIAALPAAEAEAYRIAEAQAVQFPYLGLAATLVVLAVFMALFRLPTIASVEAPANQGKAEGSAWKYRHLVLGALGIFTYVGGEVTIGSFLVNYLHEPSIAGLTEAQAAKYVSVYWSGAMVGRFIGTFTLRAWKPARVLAIHAAVVVALVLTTIVTSGPVAMWSVLVIGLFNSIMFPTIFTLALEGLGKHTSQGSGILCMAIVGGALVPFIQGTLADKIGIHHSFVVPVLCYAYIVWYGLKGYVPRGPAVATLKA